MAGLLVERSQLRWLWYTCEWLTLQLVKLLLSLAGTWSKNAEEGIAITNH